MARSSSRATGSPPSALPIRPPFRPVSKTVDMAGATIIPGIIDAHAHGPHGVGDIIPQQNWDTIAHLAFGVTTIHDPSNTASHIFPAAEMQQAGVILAPRIFSTAEIVYGARAPSRYALINNLEDAQEHVRRLRLQGAHSIKNYNQPRREQRQQVVAAAIEQNIAVVAEGGSLFGMDMALIADGNTTLEHNIPQAVLYEDVLSFFGQTDVGYTPTLVVTYSGLAADPYWRAHTDVWRHPILSRVTCRRAFCRPIMCVGRSRRKRIMSTTKLPPERMPLRNAAYRSASVRMARKKALAAHWEMWSFVRGGMSPLEALRAATIVPAQALGFARDIGSLEVGKLADLVVFECGSNRRYPVTAIISGT